MTDTSDQVLVLLIEEQIRHVIPIDAMPLSLPALVLEDGTEAKRFAAGVILPIGDVDLPECALAAVRDGGGRLVGIGEYREGTLRPRVVVPIET